MKINSYSLFFTVIVRRLCLRASLVMLPSLLVSFLLTTASTVSASPLQWGDQGDGTYRNPVLNADYSDPDVIRVGEKYYMVASDFHFMGMQILESTDMLNWHIVKQVYSRFDMPKWDTNERYAGGSWAPSIRYHDGKFWIYFCTPHEGLFMTQAEKPEGPWTPLHCLKAVEKWEDPCPFWDSDGKAYLGRSQHGAGPIILHRMSSDGKTLLDDGVTIYTGPVAEGTKFMKRDGWYYLSIPEGGVGEGWQTVLRSRNIYGPYERKVVLEQGTTTVNGPHQGALVDTPQGTWWFYHFQETEALGRVVHLQPVEWKDGWPVIGTDIDGNGTGEPVMQWQNPLPSEPSLPQTTDDFNSTQLSPQWQWNHNPANEAWSLTENPGELTLHALQADSFIKARNTLTQKCMGYDSEATVEIDFTHLTDGGRAGIVCMGKTNELLGIRKDGGALQLYRTHSTFKQKDGTPPTETDTVLCTLTGTAKLWLRIHFDFTARQYTFSYSTDGNTFTPGAAPFYTIRGNWKGVRFGIYHYNTLAAEGKVTVENVKYNINR